MKPNSKMFISDVLRTVVAFNMWIVSFWVMVPSTLVDGYISEECFTLCRDIHCLEFVGIPV